MLFSTSSFLLVALSSVEAVVLVGVICASISSGFGEAVFLSLTARYDRSTVTAWSSGTGAAGVAGAVIYAVLKSFLSPKVTLLIQIYMPFLLVVAYLCVLGSPSPQRQQAQEEWSHSSRDNSEEEKEEDEDKVSPMAYSEATSPLIQTQSQPAKPCGACPCPPKLFNKEEVELWWDHVKYVPHLFKYMLPLFLVYFAEYAINQGFFELLYNPNTHIGSYCLEQRTQYRWLQVVYQVGVLISRTSVSIIYIKHFWIFVLLQVCVHLYIHVVNVNIALVSSGAQLCVLLSCLHLFIPAVLLADLFHGIV